MAARHRKYFRVMEDILDNPGYRSLKPADRPFWIDLLAAFNRARAQESQNMIVVSLEGFSALMGSRTYRDARMRGGRLGVAVGVELAWMKEGVLIHIPNYAKLQGIDVSGSAPKGSAIGLPTPTPTPTPKPTADAVAGIGAKAPATPDVDGFVSMLKGKIPTGLDGEMWATPAAWFEGHREQLTLDSQRDSGQNDGLGFQRHFRALMMRWWNHKQPKGGNGRARPGKLEVIASEVEKSRQRDRERSNAQPTNETGDAAGEGREADSPGSALLDLPGVGERR